MNPHAASSETASRDASDRASPNGPPGTESVRVVCPHCATTNRVPVARLGEGARCGSCKETLLPGETFELTKASFDRQIASTDLPLVVDFWAPWCGPCRMMAPAYEQAAAKPAPRVRLAKVNSDEESEIASRFGIRGIPTLIAFKNGREVARQSRAMSLPQLLQWIQASV